MRRARALYAQHVNLDPHVEICVMISPPPTTLTDLTSYARFLRDQRSDEEKLNTRCFAVVTDESAWMDAVEIVIVDPRPGISQCGHYSVCFKNLCGPRFFIRWALAGHEFPRHLCDVRNDQSTVKDAKGVARRMVGEQEVRAHKSEDFEWIELPKCRCEWHFGKLFI